MTVGRLAPTPSGNLHLGNVLAFTAAWLSARQQGGQVLLRIEDVDVGRARPEIAQNQREDLEWLGLTWDRETPAQSTRDYGEWLELLPTYLCQCTRKQIKAQGGHLRCAGRGHTEGAIRFRVPEGVVRFDDRLIGRQQVRLTDRDDPVLRRRDGVFAYNLAVVADDIADGVDEVVRGADILPLTAVQVELWRAFGRTPPTWLHTPLVLGADGKKLSKSHGAAEVRELREAGLTAEQVLAKVFPLLGMEPMALVDAIDAFRPEKMLHGDQMLSTSRPRNPR